MRLKVLKEYQVNCPGAWNVLEVKYGQAPYSGFVLNEGWIPLNLISVL